MMGYNDTHKLIDIDLSYGMRYMNTGKIQYPSRVNTMFRKNVNMIKIVCIDIYIKVNIPRA